MRKKMIMLYLFAKMSTFPSSFFYEKHAIDSDVQDIFSMISLFALFLKCWTMTNSSASD